MGYRSEVVGAISCEGKNECLVGVLDRLLNDVIEGVFDLPGVHTSVRRK